MILPWERESRNPLPPSDPFTQHRTEGESLEFRADDAAGAAIVYKLALEQARTPVEKCGARLWLGRAQVKAGMPADAAAAYRSMLQACGAVPDADGIPFGLYAAERLLAAKQDDAAAQAYLIRRAGTRLWRPPNETYLLRSLLAAIPSPAATDALRRLSAELGDMEQIVALSQDIHSVLAKLQQASRFAPGDLSWIGYGGEPWLITFVSPTSFAVPVVMAVSAGRVVPSGVTLHARPGPGATPLGDGFVDLQVEWPANRFTPPRGVPPSLYAVIVLVILGATLLAAYLLLHDVQREVETAAMRSHFVASVSHELKTPLTAIRMFAETLLLGRAGGGEATSEYLKTILSESERLSRLVDNVLDFSRIEQGRKIYRMQATCLSDVVQSAALAMEYPLSQLGFTLTISVDETPPPLQVDADALKQAILNLIGNAMKYSGEARRIEMRLGTRENEVFIDVVDHGIGISAEDQSHIFEKFHRVRSAETEGIAGTGLGLALALHIVEAHKGRIDVSSKLGNGSTFSVRLPLQGCA